MDDARPMPKGFDLHVFTAQVAIHHLRRGSVTHISLDHDLGPRATCGSGYDVALVIEEGAYNASLPKLTWDVHSQNPIGAKYMREALSNADRFWAEHALKETQ